MKWRFMNDPESPANVAWVNERAQIACRIERSALLVAVHGTAGVVKLLAQGRLQPQGRL